MFTPEGRPFYGAPTSSSSHAAHASSSWGSLPQGSAKVCLEVYRSCWRGAWCLLTRLGSFLCCSYNIWYVCNASRTCFVQCGAYEGSHEPLLIVSHCHFMYTGFICITYWSIRIRGSIWLGIRLCESNGCPLLHEHGRRLEELHSPIQCCVEVDRRQGA